MSEQKSTLATNSHSAQHHKSVQFMIWAVFFFTFGHAAVKWVPHIPFYELVFLRAAITVVICVALLRLKKISLIGSNVPLLILRGFAGTIALTTYFYSLQNMPFASAVSIQYLSPIFTIWMAHFIMKEKTPLKQMLCYLFAFIGVLMIKGFDPRITIGELAISMISVIASAVAYNLVRKLKDFDHELIVVLYFPLVTIPIVGPYAILHWVWPSPRDWIYILVIGVFTQLAQVLMTMAYHRERASDVAIYNYLGILVSLIIGYFFFSEDISALAVSGMAMIFLLFYLVSRLQRSSTTT
jgi:drug/metabolite transporter (DMT)-like permease